MATTTLTLTKVGSMVKIVEDGESVRFESLGINPKFTYHTSNDKVNVTIGGYSSGDVPAAGVSIGGNSVSSAATLATAISSVWISTSTAQIIVTQKTSITSAQIKALNTTPITVVAAPGAGYAVQALSFLLKYTYATAVYATNTNSFIYYTGIAASKVMANNAILAETASADAIQMPANLIFSAGDLANKALLLTVATGDPTGNTAAGTLDVYVTYCLVTV